MLVFNMQLSLDGSFSNSLFNFDPIAGLDIEVIIQSSSCSFRWTKQDVRHQSQLRTKRCQVTQLEFTGQQNAKKTEIKAEFITLVMCAYSVGSKSLNLEVIGKFEDSENKIKISF